MEDFLPPGQPCVATLLVCLSCHLPFADSSGNRGLEPCVGDCLAFSRVAHVMGCFSSGPCTLGERRTGSSFTVDRSYLAGSQFCLGTSLFCLVYMLFVGYLITIDYEYVFSRLVPALTWPSTPHKPGNIRAFISLPHAAIWESGRRQLSYPPPLLRRTQHQRTASLSQASTAPSQSCRSSPSGTIRSAASRCHNYTVVCPVLQDCVAL